MIDELIISGFWLNVLPPQTMRSSRTRIKSQQWSYVSGMYPQNTRVAHTGFRVWGFLGFKGFRVGLGFKVGFLGFRVWEGVRSRTQLPSMTNDQLQSSRLALFQLFVACSRGAAGNTQVLAVHVLHWKHIICCACHMKQHRIYDSRLIHREWSRAIAAESNSGRALPPHPQPETGTLCPA